MTPERSPTPRPGEELDVGVTVVSDGRMVALEARVTNGEGDLKEIRDLIRERKESQDRLESKIDARDAERHTMDLQIVDKLGQITGASTFAKWAAALLVTIALGVLGTVVAIANMILNHVWR